MSGINEYSTTPGSNSTINSINVAEGCAPSGINNAIRQQMADLRAWYNDAEWVQYGDGDGGATVAFASSTSFTVAGVDVTGEYHAGRRVRVVGSTTGTIYGTISSSSFSTNTTVNVTWDSGSLTNETLTISLAIMRATNVSVPMAAFASETASGTVELATTAEAQAGTDTARAVTPAGLKAAKAIDRETSTDTVANTTTETAIYSKSIPADTLGTDRALRLTFIGDYLNNSGANTSLTVKVKFGETTICSATLSNIGSSAARRPFLVKCFLTAQGATNKQVARTQATIAGGNADASDGTANSLSLLGAVHNAVAEDSTEAKTLQVTVTHSAADGDLEAKRLAATLELI